MAIDEHVEKLLISFPRAIDSSEAGRMMEYLGDELGATTGFSSHEEWIRNPSHDGDGKTTLKSRASGKVTLEDIHQEVQFMSYTDSPSEYNAMRLVAPHSPVNGRLLPEDREEAVDTIRDCVNQYFSDN